MTIIDTHIPTVVSTAVLGMALLDANNQSVLRLGRGAQKLVLELRNLTDSPIEIGDEHGSSLNLTFRPGALEGIKKVKASGSGWTGSMVPGRTTFHTLQITRKQKLAINARDAIQIGITGLVPSGAGGSRSTRVEVEYDNVALVGKPPISGRRIVHLGLLHPDVPPGQERGSVASSGPFVGRIRGTGQVLAGGGQNMINVDLKAKTPFTVPANGDGDSATIEFDFQAPRSSVQISDTFVPKADSGWGAFNDTLELSLDQDRRLSQSLATIPLQIVAPTEPGLYPLVLRYENFGELRGELVFLLQVTAIGVDSLAGDRAPLIAKRPLTVEGALSATSVTSTNTKFHMADEWTMSSSGAGIFFNSHTKKTQVDLWDYGTSLTIMAENESGSHVPLNIGGLANVGIGTNEPTAKLHVRGSATIEGNLTVTGNAGDLTVSSIKSTSTHFNLSDQWTLRSQENMWNMASASGGSQFRFWDNGSGSELAVTNARNTRLPLTLGVSTRVGINTLSPQDTLDVDGTLGVSGRINLSHGWYIAISGRGSQLQFKKEGDNEHSMFLITKDGEAWSRSGSMGTITT